MGFYLEKKGACTNTHTHTHMHAYMHACTHMQGWFIYLKVEVCDKSTRNSSLVMSHYANTRLQTYPEFVIKEMSQC